MDKKLRKMISTGALSVALISWYTTANGLHVYVFRHMWQAYVISAALQGVLFSLSIKGVDLLIELKNRKKKIELILSWALLLFTSSIFSYIYISGDVYTDNLLREDAQRILNTYCLDENYKLLSISNELLNGNNSGIEFELDKYVKTLAVTENGVEISNDSKKQMENLIKALKLYDNNSNLINTFFLVERIEDFMKGKNTDNDIEIIKEEINNIITRIEEKVKETNNEIDYKEALVSDYQHRLSQYTNTTSPAYIDLTNKLNSVEVELSSLRTTLSELGDERDCVNRVITTLNGIEGSMESALYNKVLNLRTEMNAEKIEINNVQKIAEEIYNILLENNVKSNDSRLTQYSRFRNNLKKYELIIEAQQHIESEIQLLYNLTDVNPDLLAKNEEWSSYWRTRLNSLKYSVQLLHSGGMNSDTIGELLTSIDIRERLYLSDLNDFERAISLLFGKNPKHQYKTMLCFSFFFSFGVDLFSVLMSWLLYLLKSNANKACSQ